MGVTQLELETKSLSTYIVMGGAETQNSRDLVQEKNKSSYSNYTLDELPVDSEMSLKPESEETRNLLETDSIRPRETWAIGSEYSVPAGTKVVVLCVYFALNLGLTIYNKAVLGPFPFPFLLTSIHALIAFLGCLPLYCLGHFQLSRLGRKENIVLVAFSTLFTLNIALSNVSLALVSIAFHQITSYATATYLSLIPIVLGVGIATFGDIYVTAYGCALTLLGVFASSVKTVATNRILTGRMALPPLELLFRMAPLAALQALLYAAVTKEYVGFTALVAERKFSFFFSIQLLLNGLLAFFVNVSSFNTNKLAGALTQTVAGNVKQCLTIILGSAIFHTIITPMNSFGIILTILGSAWYSQVEFSQKRVSK